MENFKQFLNISGIACSCGYRNDDVIFEHYPEYIDKECPDCQKNLLTKEEYSECLELIQCGEKLDKKYNLTTMDNVDIVTILQDPDMLRIMHYVAFAPSELEVVLKTIVDNIQNENK